MNPIKKIILINPPIQDFFQTEIRQQPLGLEYIQAVLDREGYQTYLLDCLGNNKKRTIPIPKLFNYLKQYYPTNDLSPFKLFTHYRHFGMSFEQIGQHVKDFQPDLIGISLNFTPYVEMAVETARLCKSIFPLVPIVAGGHHATAVPADLIKTEYFDYVILGEGEERILQLIDALAKNDVELLKSIDGIAYRDRGQIVINPIQSHIQNLDQLPILEIKNDIGMLITSRGCPKNCNFCSISKVMGKKVRIRSIESVMKEIEIGIKNGVRQFDFEDDHLTINKGRAKNLFSEIASRFSSFNLTFSAMNGMLADTLDEELVKIMKSAGFEWLNIPLVSGSSAIQQQIERNQSYQHFSKVVSWAQKYGLKIIAYLIIGLPEDNLDQAIDDIIFLADLPVLIGPSIFYPPPGSATFENCIQIGYISGIDYSLYRSSALFVETENFSRRDLITLFRLVRMINFIKHLIDEDMMIIQKLSEYLSQNTILLNSELTFERRLQPDEIGILLLNQLFREFKLRGLFLKNRAKNNYEYEWLDYKISEELIMRLLRTIHGKEITGVSHQIKWRVE
jgi:anaerobic magnesium-protoporphyrin IX monomethyl ester cyclase